MDVCQFWCADDQVCKGAFMHGLLELVFQTNAGKTSIQMKQPDVWGCSAQRALLTRHESGCGSVIGKTVRQHQSPKYKINYISLSLACKGGNRSRPASTKINHLFSKILYSLANFLNLLLHHKLQLRICYAPFEIAESCDIAARWNKAQQTGSWFKNK